MLLLECMVEITGFAMSIGKLDTEFLIGVLEMCDSTT